MQTLHHFAIMCQKPLAKTKQKQDSNRPCKLAKRTVSPYVKAVDILKLEQAQLGAVGGSC